MNFEQPITEIIKRRRSVRNFSDAGITPETEAKIRQILSSHTAGPVGNAVNFYLVNKKMARNKLETLRLTHIHLDRILQHVIPQDAQQAIPVLAGIRTQECDPRHDCLHCSFLWTD